MSTLFSLSSASRRTLALALVAGSAFAVAGAQTAPAVQSAGTAQPVNFSLAGLGTTSSLMLSESSSVTDAGVNAASTNLASLETNFRLPDANAQYGRRRYGATRYRGSNTNADGSEKYTFYAGGGFEIPAATEFNYATTSWGFQVGGGRNFNRHFGVDLEFDYDHFGMSGATLTNQQNLYNYYIGLYNATAAGAANPVTPISGLDGNNHIWSFTLDPTYTIYSGQGLGAYLIGGGGFYHKVANFTVPAEGEYCDYYGFCYAYTANEVIDHYTSNAPGLNGGIGFTYKFSRFANEKLYGEVRYAYIFNSARPGVTVDNATAANANIANDFPQNSNRTPYLPVKFGIRF